MNILNSIRDILNSRGVKDPKLEFRSSRYILSAEPFDPLLIDSDRKQNLEVSPKDPGIEIVIDRSMNPGIYPQWWESVLELDFIKEIEEKTDYLYNSHFYKPIDRDPTYQDIESGSYPDDEILIIHLGHKNWSIEGGYIYLDEALKNGNVLMIGNDLDDIFNLGWPDGDYDFSKNWGLFYDGMGQQVGSYSNTFTDFNWQGRGGVRSSNRPSITNEIDIQDWKLKFTRSDSNKNSELIGEFIIPFLKRLKSEYNIEIISCKNYIIDLEFNEDLESVRLKNIGKVEIYQDSEMSAYLDQICSYSYYKSFDIILKFK